MENVETWATVGVYSAKLRQDHIGMIVGYNVYYEGRLVWDFLKGSRRAGGTGKLDKMVLEHFRCQYEALHATVTKGERAMDRGYDNLPISKNQQTRPI